jgi:hypothetical protein
MQIKRIFPVPVDQMRTSERYTCVVQFVKFRNQERNVLLLCSELSSGSIIRDLMMEAVRTSETSVDNYFTRQYNPEDSSEHHTRRRENLKKKFCFCVCPEACEMAYRSVVTPLPRLATFLSLLLARSRTTKTSFCASAID